MYGRDPNDFVDSNLQLSDQDFITLRFSIASQRQRVMSATFELIYFDRSSVRFKESKRVKLLEKLHRERVALDDMELAHTVATKNSEQFRNEQSDYREELDKLWWKDKEEIDRRTEALKLQNDEQLVLVRIRNMLADFIGMVELRMRNQDRIKLYTSGDGIVGSRVSRKKRE